jgi:hypothetical protein
MLVLKIDVDHNEPMPIVELLRRSIRAKVKIVSLAQRRSPSGRGWHVLLNVKPAPKTAMETVALQLLFGSDPYREAYNINRARAVDGGDVSPFWRRRWNVFYGRAD